MDDKFAHLSRTLISQIMEQQANVPKENKKQRIVMSNWRVITDAANQERLFGFPHSKHSSPLVSGKQFIITSPIIGKYIDKGWVETENSVYLLVGESLRHEDIDYGPK